MLAGAIACLCDGEPESGITHRSGVLAALVAGIALALLFAVISLTLQANQTATGLALTIFGRGFSALVGAGYVGIPAPTLPKLHIPLLSDIPVLGPVVFPRRRHPGLCITRDSCNRCLGDPCHPSWPDFSGGGRLA